jgi:molecular chaperone DnaJ
LLNKDKNKNMKEDLYKVLGISKNATDTEIKKAYRSKAKEHHPDKGGDSEMFNKVSYAYEVLSTPDKKKTYDTRGHDGLNPQQRQQNNPYGNGFEDIFRQMEKQQQQQQEIIRTTVSAVLLTTLEDIFNGITKTVSYNRFLNCDPCNGKGGSNPKACVGCGGSGQVAKLTRTAHGYMQEIQQCPNCTGSGKQYENTCSTCQGKGKSTERHQETIEIPYSTMSGEYIIFRGLGHVRENGSYGDLQIKVEIAKTDNFEILQGYSLLSVVKIPYEIMVLGGKVEFMTIDKVKIKFIVPKLSEIGNKVRISGKGLKIKGDPTKRADQIIVLDINIPTEVSDEEIELLEKIKKLKE